MHISYKLIKQLKRKLANLSPHCSAIFSISEDRRPRCCVSKHDAMLEIFWKHYRILYFAYMQSYEVFEVSYIFWKWAKKFGS